MLRRVGGDRRPLDAAVGARQHARAVLGRQHPHVLLRDHRLGEADEAAILGVVDVDVAGLAGVQDDLGRLAVLAGRLGKHGRRNRVEVPYVMGDILEVADVFAGVEVERDHRVGVEIVAGPDGAVEVGRGIADDEIDAVGCEIDARVLPHAAAERLIGIAALLHKPPSPPRCRGACRARWRPWSPRRPDCSRGSC